MFCTTPFINFLPSFRTNSKLCMVCCALREAPLPSSPHSLIFPPSATPRPRSHCSSHFSFLFLEHKLVLTSRSSLALASRHHVTGCLPSCKSAQKSLLSPAPPPRLFQSTSPFHSVLFFCTALNLCYVMFMVPVLLCCRLSHGLGA